MGRTAAPSFLASLLLSLSLSPLSLSPSGGPPPPPPTSSRLPTVRAATPFQSLFSQTHKLDTALDQVRAAPQSYRDGENDKR
jgi:hypothetical protein